MTQQPPIPLEYKGPDSPNDPGRRKRFIRHMLIGLGCGILFSMIGWPATFAALRTQHDYSGLWLLILVPATKFIAGIVLACLPARRGLGVGILLSLGIGGLIFLGICFSSM